MRTRVRPIVVDAALTAGLLAATLYEGRTTPGGWRPFDDLAYALSTAAALPLLLRRWAPVWAMAACGVCWQVYVLAGYWPVANTYAYLLLLYTVASLRSQWYVAGGVAAALVVWGVGVYLAGANLLLALGQALAVLLTVCWAGLQARRLAEATVEVTRSQHERARRAVLDERMRIARELHDVVAHHLSVISIQTGLAKYVYRSDPQTAGTALDTVESLIAETLREMRRMLILLRVEATDPQDAYHPAPGLSDVPALVERVRAAGLDAELTVTGQARRLPPGVELCAYRVVQEGLTNVLTHAAPTSARVVLDYGSADLTVTVADDGPAGPARAEPAAAARARLTTGQGLIGMRERALLYGGTLEAGPRQPRGFAVRLTLPTAGSEAPS